MYSRAYDIRYSKLVNISVASINIFYSKDSMAAIIIFYRNLVVTKVSRGIDLHLVMVEVQLNRTSFSISTASTAVEDPPIEDHMSRINNIRLLT